MPLAELSPPTPGGSRPKANRPPALLHPRDLRPTKEEVCSLAGRPKHIRIVAGQDGVSLWPAGGVQKRHVASYPQTA